MITLGRVIALAATSHQDAKDKGGNAYILHSIRIMMRLRTTDEELMMIAIMHDVLEDDKSITVEKLKELGFTERVIAALIVLTHIKGESYEDYIRKISTNDDAIIVKLQDLQDNSDVSRLKGLTQNDFERMIKYQKSYKYLKEVQASRKSIFG